MSAAALAPSPAAGRADTARMLGDWLAAERAAAQPFSWRQNNCCHFAARWVVSATGRHWVSINMVGVSGPLAARRRVPFGLALHVSALLGMDARVVQFAQVGDLVLLPQAGHGVGAVLGVCGGRVAWVLDPAGQPGAVDMALATMCWPLWPDAAAATAAREAA